jgi:hypothetical protein
LLLSHDERAVLERWTRRASSAQALALRARIVMVCTGPEGPPIVAVARELREAATPSASGGAGSWRDGWTGWSTSPDRVGRAHHQR